MTHMADRNMFDRNWLDAEATAKQLNHRYDQNSPAGVLNVALNLFGKRFAIVSSFGAESAVLLHIAAGIDSSIPVIFVDTGKLFGETRKYRDRIMDQLGLTNVQTVKPVGSVLGEIDPKGHLWRQDNNLCCFHRKVLPLKEALAPFDAWASGRKRFHGGERTKLRQFDHGDGKVKVNPLAWWNKSMVEDYMERFRLPVHPLVADGFTSIGCMPCTGRSSDMGDARSGRWAGQNKSECGIHLGLSENIRKLEKPPIGDGETK